MNWNAEQKPVKEGAGRNGFRPAIYVGVGLLLKLQTISPSMIGIDSLTNTIATIEVFRITGSNSDGEQCSISDGELLRRWREGSEDAATVLYKRYATRLQRMAERQTDAKMASRIDPEGIVQSMFRTFFRRVTDGQYQVAEGDDLWNLLLVMSLNKLRKEAARQRTAKRDIKKTQPLVEADQESRQTDNQAFIVLKMTINEVLENISDAEREIVKLRISGNEVNQIAEKTGRAKRSVERILHKFRQLLSDSIDS